MFRLVLYQDAPIRLSSRITDGMHSKINQSYYNSEPAELLNGDDLQVQEQPIGPH